MVNVARHPETHPPDAQRQRKGAKPARLQLRFEPRPSACNLHLPTESLISSSNLTNTHSPFTFTTTRASVSETLKRETLIRDIKQKTGVPEKTPVHIQGNRQIGVPKLPRPRDGNIGYLLASAPPTRPQAHRWLSEAYHAAGRMADLLEYIALTVKKTR
jgi:hypothetical protein